MKINKLFFFKPGFYDVVIIDSLNSSLFDILLKKKNLS